MGEIAYSIEIELFEGQGSDMHRVGERFQYPEGAGKICPWLFDSINSMVRVLQFGGRLPPWTYKDPIAKEADVEGLTTEFVRCPDPTQAGVVAKITRRKRPMPKKVGWA